MTLATRIVVHVLLFLLAIVVFYVGLGVGLQINPILGTALWIAAGTIAVGNVVWIFYIFYRKQQSH